MKKILCIIQEGMFSNAQIMEMEQGFKSIYSSNYSKEKLTVLWMVMPKGYAYAERKPSNAAVIMLEVDENITKAKREELMSLTSQFLLNNFNISPLDSVITVANASFVNAFMKAQKNRVAPLYRPMIAFKQFYTAFTSKLTNGYLRLRVKF